VQRVLGIFQRVDHGFCGQPVADGILPRRSLAFLGHSRVLSWALRRLSLPPCVLIAASLELTVVESADGDGEPVADFPPHRPLLGKLEVARIGWLSPAVEARVSGDKL
jgi:hypothetical protein